MEHDEVMETEASWSAAFDPAMSVDESEVVMAQLFGFRGFSNSQQDHQMLRPDHNGNIPYDFSHDLNYKDDAPAANYEGYYSLSYPQAVPAIGVCSGPMNFSTNGDQLGSYKRPGRASASVPKKGRNARAKKAQKSENTCCYCSEDDGSQELNAAGTAATALKKADRGSATDPLSLYARKRRERINERLRILQNLIPNGTKVDLSTMLEEAVQYVKFLQLQIKLLSSDDLWMYAPVAYNGVNLGIDLQISQRLLNDIQRR